MSPFLSKRLSAVAELVPQCETLADIGTDHGLLPAFLLSSGRIQRAICTDINPLPLSAAAATFRASGLYSRADFREGDGLSPLLPGEAGAVCIAGMGGETIAGILEAAPFAAAPRPGGPAEPVFILQPMTRAAALRKYLAGADYVVCAWRLCLDRGRLYEILKAKRAAALAPEDVEPGLSPRPETENLFLHIGRPTQKTAELYPLYIETALKRTKKELRGAKGEKKEELSLLISAMEGLLKEFSAEPRTL